MLLRLFQRVTSYSKVLLLDMKVAEGLNCTNCCSLSYAKRPMQTITPLLKCAGNLQFNRTIAKTNQKFVLPSRNFQTSSPRRIPPVLLLAVKSVGKALAILTGRGFRKWWRNLPANKKQYFWTEFKKNRVRIALISGLSLVLIGIYYETHVQETPITKRKRFVALTSKQFQTVAQFEYELQRQLFQGQLLPTTDPSYMRVGQIVHRLLTANSNLKLIPNRIWSISVINAEVQNAFVLPGGQIFVFKGMLDLCSRDDELAIILAHEIAHCILEHGVEQLSYSHLLDFVAIAVLAAIWAFVPSDGIAIITQWFFHKVISIMLSLPYSRKLETEADEVGLELAAKACFDVRESSAFWSKMAFSEKLESGDVNVEWLSTHPRHEARSAHLDSIMAQAEELRNLCGCPKLPAQDPRDRVNILRHQIEAEVQRRKSEPNSLIITVPGK